MVDERRMANPEIQLYTGGQAQVEWGVLSKTTGRMAGALHRGGWNMQLPLSGSSCPWTWEEWCRE